MSRPVTTAKLAAENLMLAPDVELENRIHSALSAAVMAGEVVDYQHTNPGDKETWLIWGRGYEHSFSLSEAHAFCLGLQAAFRATQR